MRFFTKAAFLLLGGLPVGGAAVPVVSKVEPPDWVAPAHDTSLRLLLTGRELGNARVSACAPMRVADPSSSADGIHLFVDLLIPARTPPGPCTLRVQNGGGNTPVPFALVAPLAVDHRFQGFSPDDVVYLIMPDRFANGDPRNDDPAVSAGLYDRRNAHYYHGGDLEGIRQHLPYLKDLGVTAIWLTPIVDNANRLSTGNRNDDRTFTDYHGYGAVDFYSVDEHFGTVDLYRELIDEAHRLGIKVIQDHVANHTGPFHPWVKDPPTPTWYHGTPAEHLANASQTWTLMDPHATAETRKATLEGWFANILPDLNQDDPEVARYLIQNTLWWIGRTGLDGIREDTLPYVPRAFWRDWMAAIRRDYPNLRVVGEVFDADPALVSFFQGGKARFDGIDSGADTVFDFPLYFAMRRAFAQGMPVRDLAVVLGHDGLYTRPDLLVTLLGLHDVRRFMDEPGATVAGLKLAFTFLMTTRGIPMIYYGDEIAMTGGNDPRNRRDFPGGWPGDTRNGFDASGRTPEQQEVWSHVQKLAMLRREIEPLRKGALVDLAVTDQSYVFARVIPGHSAIVAINNGAAAVEIACAAAPASIREGASAEDRIGAAPAAHVQNGVLKTNLPPRSAAVYEFK